MSLRLILELNSHHTGGKPTPIGSVNIDKVFNGYQVSAFYRTKDGEDIETSFTYEEPNHLRNYESAFNLASEIVGALMKYDERFKRLYYYQYLRDQRRTYPTGAPDETE